jgi:D-aminopeptidase
MPQRKHLQARSGRKLTNFAPRRVAVAFSAGDRIAARRPGRAAPKVTKVALIRAIASQAGQQIKEPGGAIRPLRWT